MTSEIDCTTRTKQKSTLSVDTLYRTRVRMLGPTLVPSVNSIVRTVIVTRKLQSLAATAAALRGALGDPVRPTSPRARGLVIAMFSQYWEYARVPGFEQQSVDTRAIFSSFVCSVSSNCRCYLGSFKRLQRLCAGLRRMTTDAESVLKPFRLAIQEQVIPSSLDPQSSQVTILSACYRVM